MGRFTLEELDHFYSLAMQLTEDAVLGLHLAERASEAAFDVVGHLVTRAPTLRDGLRLLSQFGPIMLTDGALMVSETPETVRITTRCGRLSARGARFQADLTMAGMLRLARFYVSPLARTSAVYFEHDGAAERAEYLRTFGCVPVFSHTSTAIEFPRAWLDRRVRHSSGRRYSLLLDEARRSLDSLENGERYRDRVERYVLSFPPARSPPMVVAARDLGISARSLRRYLTAEGTTYRTFVEAALERAATEMLRNPARTVQDAASVTGYSEAAAFSRAFKRWTGVTPAEYRRNPR